MPNGRPASLAAVYVFKEDFCQIWGVPEMSLGQRGRQQKTPLNDQRTEGRGTTKVPLSLLTRLEQSPSYLTSP